MAGKNKWTQKALNKNKDQFTIQPPKKYSFKFQIDDEEPTTIIRSIGERGEISMTVGPNTWIQLQAENGRTVKFYLEEA